ncbi:ParA family protein, partial [Escherichia coli]
MTISVGIFNGKGGVTKSTIARALAVAYAKAGWNVCLIDMDVLNGTVTRWVQRRMANNIEPAIAAQPCGTPSQVQKIIESEVYDLVIVDGGAYASESVPKLSEFLDMVILPTRFSTD